MLDTPVPASEEGESDGVPLKDEMRQLRSLLLQTEIDKINDLERRLSDQATKTRDVSDILA